MPEQSKSLPQIALISGAIPALVALQLFYKPAGPGIILAFLGAGFFLARFVYAKFTRLEKSRQTVSLELKDLKHDLKELNQANLGRDQLMEVCHDAIVVVDEDGKIIEANPAIAARLGYRPKELSGCLLPDLASSSEGQTINKLISEALSLGSVSITDLTLTQENTCSWFDGTARLIAGTKPAQVQIVLKDITESKRQYVLTEKEISFIHELSRALPTFQDFDNMLERILGMLNEALPFHGFALVLAEPNDARATICVNEATENSFITGIKDSIGEVFSELVDIPEAEFVVERKTMIESAGKSVGSQIMLPLTAVNGLAGLFSSEERAFKKEDLSLFSTMVSGISSLYLAYRSYKQVEHLSVSDPLTNLFNRRKFFEELEREIERVSRYGAPMCLLMLDIDHFKSVNDIFGHQMGDEVLRELSKILISSTRKTDIVARYGGEEFIIMLTETPLKGALEVANRIKESIEKAVILGPGIEIHFTASLGMAEFEKGDDSDTLVGRADKALYNAKQNGRNRIELVAS